MTARILEVQKPNKGWSFHGLAEKNHIMSMPVLSSNLKCYVGKQMIEIHVKDIKPDPGLWVSFDSKRLKSKFFIQNVLRTGVSCLVLTTTQRRHITWENTNSEKVGGASLRHFCACLAFFKLAMLGKRTIQMAAERKLSLGHQVSFKVLNPTSECFHRSGLSCLILKATQ